MLPPVPRCSDWASSSLISPSRISLPRNCSRVRLHIDLFEACSAFTRVAARTLAPSPIRDLLHRRLQPFCHLHDCSGCFRLERLPGGACTHWKAPPCHGAHVKRTLAIAMGGFAVALSGHWEIAGREHSRPGQGGAYGLQLVRLRPQPLRRTPVIFVEPRQRGGLRLDQTFGSQALRSPPSL